MGIGRWFRLLLAVVVLLLAGSWGISGALRYGWARRSLLARLSASFGRPVEVQRFAFSLMGGPHLEAQAVTVAEDPRFGQEYFLRADQLTAGLRWMALLRGRVEFGTLSLAHPSLNLVHAVNGHWNVESWLPPAKTPSADRAAETSQDEAGTGDAPVPPAKRLNRIEVDDGRINFKLGQEKLLFALAAVSGHLDQDSAGRWSIDLQADPMRASVALQDAGRLRLRGSVAGTSVRLRPAALTLTWEQVSLADAVRLASGQDYGVRGVLAAEVSATLADSPAVPEGAAARDGWKVGGTLRLAELHRWDLPARPADPALNLTLAAAWRADQPRLEIGRLTVESPHSRILASGDVDWSHGFDPALEIQSSEIGLPDLLEWSRSFRSAQSNGLVMDGIIALQGKAGGWPLRVQDASIASTGATLQIPGLPGGIRVGPIAARTQRNTLVLNPVAISLPGSPGPASTAVPVRSGQRSTAVEAPGGLLRVDGTLGPFRQSSRPRDWNYRLTTSGQTARSQDLTTALRAMGWPINTDWSVEGPTAWQLAWAGSLGRKPPAPSGTIDLRGLQLTAAGLNQPLLVSQAGIELRPGGRRVKLSGAEAFGAHWAGTLERAAADEKWRFDLTADHLDVADLDRWVGPRARSGFLERLLPFAGASDLPPVRDAAIKHLMAGGRLRVGEVLLTPLSVEKLDATVELTDLGFTLRNARASFFDGRLAGDLEVQLASDPAYIFQGQFDRVNLAALTSSPARPGARFSGVASGELLLSAHGIGKRSLLASLAGQGALRVRDPFVQGLDLVSAVSATAEPRSPGEDRFVSATAGFRISSSRIRVDQLLLATRDERFEIRGSVDFARQLDLHLWSLAPAVDASSEPDHEADREEWAIRGTLDKPILTRPAQRAASNTAAAPKALLGRR